MIKATIKPRPIVEALDSQGLPCLRAAMTVSDLPHEERGHALQSCGPMLSQAIGAPIVSQLRYGTPVHLAFGMTRAQAKNHPQKKLLLTSGCDVLLDYCALFEMPSHRITE